MSRTNIISLFILALIFCCSSLLSGCETSEDNAVSKAQACLDSATPSNAASCTQDIEGLESDTASLIRCSADFLTQGFDASAMAAAYTQLSNSSGNTTTAMMSYLVFSTTGAGATPSTALANKAASDCTKSKVPSLALLGAFAQTATLVASLCSSTCTFDPSSDRDTGFPSAGFTSGITALYVANDPTNNAIIGNAVLTAYNQNCTLAGNATTEICEQVVAAINGSRDPATVGRNLITNLHNNP